MTSDSWQVASIKYYLYIFAEMVGEEQYAERVRICELCPFFGEVDIPGVRVLGCKKCGCPVETKPRVLKYFSVIKAKMVVVECPDGRWPKL